MAYTYGSVTNCKVVNGQTRTEYECRLGYQVNSQSIENNTSNITLRLEVRSISSSYGTYGYNQTTTIDGISLSASKFDMRSTNTWQVFGTRTINITHNSDGAYSASKSGSFTTTTSASNGGNYALKSGSASVTIAPATIPRASVFGLIGNFTIGEPINIPITKYSSSFTDTLDISLNGTIIKTISNIKSGYDVNFTTSELNQIYGLLPSNTYGTFTFKLTTKSGSTTIGTVTQTSRGTISTSIKPTISSITITEAGLVPSDWGVFVKNKSKLNFKISASAGIGSSISSITALVNGEPYSGSEFTTNPINKIGDVFYEVKVTDNRERPASSTNTITFVDYGVPYITSASAIRSDSNGVESDAGTYLRVDLKASVYSVESHNTSLYEVYYKKTTEDEWESHTLSSSGIAYEGYALIPNIDTNSSYDVQIKVTDYFTHTIKTLPTIPTAFTTVDYLNGGHGMAIGKVAENEDLLDVEFNGQFNKNLEVKGDLTLNEVNILDVIYPIESVYVSNTNTNPSSKFGGTWELVDKDYKNQAGKIDDAFTPNTDIVTSHTLHIERNNSTIRIRLQLTLSAGITDSDNTLGKIDYTKLGCAGFNYNMFSYPMFFDTGNTIFCLYIGGNGDIITKDIMIRGGATSTPVTEGYIDFQIPVRFVNKLDSDCDKFYWKRTA